jgi:hypothetical protein
LSEHGSEGIDRQALARKILVFGSAVGPVLDPRLNVLHMLESARNKRRKHFGIEHRENVLRIHDNSDKGDRHCPRLGLRVPIRV